MIKNNFIINYIRDSWLELTRVKWPTQKEIINHTIVVIISVLAATAITAAIDFGLSRAVEFLVKSGG